MHDASSEQQASSAPVMHAKPCMYTMRYVCCVHLRGTCRVFTRLPAAQTKGVRRPRSPRRGNVVTSASRSSESRLRDVALSRVCWTHPLKPRTSNPPDP